MKFEVETSTESFIIQIGNQKIKQILIGQLNTPQELDLQKIVGCVVIIDKDDPTKVVKVVKMKSDYKLEKIDINFGNEPESSTPTVQFQIMKSSIPMIHLPNDFRMTSVFNSDDL